MTAVSTQIMKEIVLVKCCPRMKPKSLNGYSETMNILWTRKQILPKILGIAKIEHQVQTNEKGNYQAE